MGQTIARLVSPSDATAVVDKILEFLDQNGIEEYGDIGLLEMDDVTQWLSKGVMLRRPQSRHRTSLPRFPQWDKGEIDRVGNIVLYIALLAVGLSYGRLGPTIA